MGTDCRLAKVGVAVKHNLVETEAAESIVLATSGGHAAASSAGTCVGLLPSAAVAAAAAAGSGAAAAAAAPGAGAVLVVLLAGMSLAGAGEMVVVRAAAATSVCVLDTASSAPLERDSAVFSTTDSLFLLPVLSSVEFSEEQHKGEDRRVEMLSSLPGVSLFDS